MFNRFVHSGRNYYRTNTRLSDAEINQQKILEIINGLNPNKSHGCDNISIKVNQICRNQIVLPLKFVFESCVNSGMYPDLWKMSNVCPVHKKESKNLLKNYRPITLLPIHRHLYDTQTPHISLVIPY